MKPVGKPITLARVGGLSPNKHKNDRAPESRGIYAFIWPQIELFLLGSTDSEGVILPKNVAHQIPKYLRQLAGLKIVPSSNDDVYVFGPKEQLTLGEKILQEEGVFSELRTLPLVPHHYMDDVLKENWAFSQGFVLVVHAKKRRPSRYDQLRNRTERLRKFKYTGLLWSILDGGPRGLQRQGMWTLHHSEDLVKIASDHYHDLKKSRRKDNQATTPPGASPRYSKDEWEVFVPANRGVIT